MQRKTIVQNIPEIKTLTPSQAHFPRHLGERLGNGSPSRVWAIGNVDILNERKVGLLCSADCPAEAAVKALNAACKLRDEGVTVVSGFHSPIEKECLQILLQGNQPIIVCLARGLAKIRLPPEWRTAVESGRLLLLSIFERTRRADKETARRRNQLVAALADEILIIHATPGGQIARIAELADRWRLPGRTLIQIPK